MGSEMCIRDSCNTMLSDGIKNKEMDENVEVKDIAELIASAEGM